MKAFSRMYLKAGLITSFNATAPASNDKGDALFAATTQLPTIGERHD
jgi:hypothetical protein